eukprot:COSAG01_NODE_9628_length_2385_cov_1.463255_1_plen_291_part_10
MLCLAGQGSQKIFASTVDDSTPHGALHAPHDMAMAQGSLGKYLFIIPSLNVTISTLGMSDSSSLECVGDDDAFLVSFVWNAIAEAVVPNHTTTVARGPKSQTANAGSIPAAATEHMPARLFAPARPKHVSTVAAAATPVTAPDSGEAGDAGQVHGPATIVGSCTCACPPGQGFGACFNIDQASAPLPPTPRPPPPPGGRWHRTPGPCERLPPNSSVAIALATSAATYCPDVGVAAQCKWPEEAGRDLCYADWANNHSHGLETTTLLTPCHQIAGLPPAFSVATCSRRFHAF